MTPERWQRIDGLLQEVVERPREERAAFLNEACPDQASRKEVESLISFHEQAENFLEVPAFEATAELLADQCELLVGLELGPYRIERLLGAGGMGEVYLAEDTKLDRRVAIKFLPPDLEADELAKRRLIREARAAAKLEHPNICATHEVTEEAGRSFIVMQYVEGETLGSRIQRKPLELRESLEVIVQVADALAEAHSRGIIHRDIKPQNIMITPRGQVKVLDFGLAKLILASGLTPNEGQTPSVLSAPGVVVGTAPYMSPEQARGVGSVDARSDLFSIGVVLYECIAGRPPFSGATAIETCSQVIHVDPPPPSKFNPHVTPSLDALTLKALAKQPDARHQSARELLEELLGARATLRVEDHVSTKPIEVKVATSRVGALVTLSNVLQRRRVLILASVAALAIALVVFVIVRSRPPATPNRPSLEAVRWYNQGTSALRDGLYYKASNAFQSAVDASGDFALAHANLAEAMTELDYTERANYEIIRARSLVRDLSKLPVLDALYLQAITDAVSRDFDRAIVSYREIVRQAQDSEKAYAYVDLGRAYEKNDQIDEAIKSYLKATELAPEDPAGFLRLGILYGRKQETANAEASFQRAQAIYQTMSNLEGIAEVLYQNAVVSNNLAKLADARAKLEKALDIALTINNKHQQIKILLELGRVCYVDGKTTQARQQVNRAMELAQANGMENLSTQGLVDLGYAFLFGGDYGEAETYFKQALDIAQFYKARRNEAKALFSIGNARVVQHDVDGGLPYIERALAFYQRGGYRKEVSQALIQLARAKGLKGDYDAALRAFEQQIEIAKQIGDQSQIARSHGDIGNLLNQQERYTEALGHLEECSAIYNSLENHLYLGYSLADRGDALWRLGRYEEGRDALSQASGIASQPENENRQLLAKISLIVANLMLSERRFNEAKATSRRALALNAGAEPEVDARYTLGLAQALSGKKREGELMCEQAVEMARHMHDPQVLPNALLALAEARLEADDPQGALTAALEAQEMFARNGRQESEWRAALIAGSASMRTGDLANGRQQLSRADNLLVGLEAKWGTSAYNQYLTRPDVQYSRQHLSQALNVNR